MWATKVALALALAVALRVKARSRLGGEHSRLALPCAEAEAWQSAEASQLADALGGVALPVQDPVHSPLHSPRHEASPVQAAPPESVTHLPEQVPEQLAPAETSHEPWQVPPVHSPLQLPCESWTEHVPLQVP
jgi:hypothetical protein